ncbi:transposase [Streptomyces sp. NPDC002677]|uniref:transposase n=1 Tax=Streptomyces sp. NPDC002677 TaxID=3154774 RepID=UPI003332835C
MREYVGEQIRPGGVLIIDDTEFSKKGTTSAGVSRPYTGTSGKIDNCQIGVFATYATDSGRALVDRELYLPTSWTEDRERCQAAKIPDERVFVTKGELAKAMARRCIAAGLPAAWQRDRRRRGASGPVDCAGTSRAPSPSSKNLKPVSSCSPALSAGTRRAPACLARGCPPTPSWRGSAFSLPGPASSRWITADRTTRPAVRADPGRP